MRLLLLSFLLLLAVPCFMEGLSPPSNCKFLTPLPLPPPSDVVYIVDNATAITNRFYLLAVCWLGHDRVSLYHLPENNSTVEAKRCEFVMSNRAELQKVKARFEGNSNKKTCGFVLLTQCLVKECAAGRYKSDGNTREYDIPGPTVNDVAAAIVTEAPSNGRQDQNVLAALNYQSAARFGAMIGLFLLFTFLAIVICCHSLYVISMLYDDFEYRRDHMDDAIFQGVPQDEEMQPNPLLQPPMPLRSPAALLETAVSRTSLGTAQSRSSMSSLDLDGTQCSRTEAPSSLVSFH